MFFKKLQKKPIFKYKTYLHKQILNQLRPSFKTNFFLHKKTKLLNSMLYNLKKIIRKRQIIKNRKRLYKLNKIFFKKTNRKLLLLISTFQIFIRKHIDSKKYKLNKKKIIFLVTRYKHKSYKTFYLNTLLKKKKLFALKWKSRFVREGTKKITYWKTIKKYIKKKYHHYTRRRKRKLRVFKRIRKISVKRYIFLDYRNKSWNNKLSLFYTLILKKRIQKTNLTVKFTRKSKKYIGDYYVNVHKRKQFIIYKRKFSLKKLNHIRWAQKFHKYVPLNYNKNVQKITLSKHMYKLPFLPIIEFKRYWKWKEQFPTNTRSLLRLYYTKLKKLKKTALVYTMQKRKYSTEYTRNAQIRRVTILHKKHNKTSRYIRHILRVIKKKPMTQENYIFKKRIKQNRQLKLYKFFYKKFSKLKFTHAKKQFVRINYIGSPIKIFKNKNWLFNNSFITKRTYKKHIIDYYKSITEVKHNNKKLKKKIKKKRVYAFNFWKKKLTILKNARQLHWDIFTKKTLKKRRYKTFLASYLKKQNTPITSMIHCFSLKFKFSNAFWNEFKTLYTKFFHKHIILKKIYQFPIHIMFWKFLHYQQNNKLKVKLKIKNWIKKTKRIKRRFWMNVKKKTPKYFFQQTLYNNKILNSIHFDYLTNYFCIVKRIKTLKYLNSIIDTNKMLKLHNIRYKA